MGLQKYRADKAGEKQVNGAVPFYTHWIGGPSLALIRNCPIENVPGEAVGPRTVYVRDMADTMFSIPAACVVKGKTIRGYIGARLDSGEYYFRAYNEG